MKNLLCILGVHKPSRYMFISEVRIKGKHKWKVTYACCDRCGKRLHRITWPKEEMKNA